MKALTLTQPWASLVALGAKRIETRSWGTGYRGPLAIHAAKGLGPVGGQRGLDALCDEEPFRSVLADAGLTVVDNGYVVNADLLPRGALVAVVQLANVVRVEAIDVHARFMVAPNEEAFGNYSPGRFAWLLNHPIYHPAEPVPCKGALGLWDVPDDAERAFYTLISRAENGHSRR